MCIFVVHRKKLARQATWQSPLYLVSYASITLVNPMIENYFKTRKYVFLFLHLMEIHFVISLTEIWISICICLYHIPLFSFAGILISGIYHALLHAAIGLEMQMQRPWPSCLSPWLSILLKLKAFFSFCLYWLSSQIL